MDKKLDILAFGAHPDDVELGCGGSLAKLSAQGKKIGIIDLTQGELGTRGTAATRMAEAENAAKILGVKIRENLCLPDGFFVDNEKNIISIIKKIRIYRPDVVLCNAPVDRHPDHGNGASLVLKCAFLSGLIKINTQQDAWRPKHVFHYIQWNELKQDFIIDISGFLDTKLEACLAYQTQFYDPASESPPTPISSKNFLDSISYRAYNLGRLIGTQAGEGFLSSQPIGLEDFDVIV